MNAAQATTTLSTRIKLGFVVNDMATEKNNYTTIRLARTAVNRGHEVALIGLGGFIYDANGTVRAHAHVPRASSYDDDDALLADLQGEDARSNLTAGGKVEMAVPDADALRLAEIVAPKLMQDGMYLAGLDIVGDKMMEINVDTPGGINMAEELTGADFSGHIIADLERKVQLRGLYNRTLSNTELAMM